MAIDTASKRGAALATFNKPWVRCVVPTGTLSRPAALGLYNGLGAAPPVNPNPPPKGGRVFHRLRTR
jgi:hypothetical protein